VGGEVAAVRRLVGADEAAQGVARQLPNGFRWSRMRMRTISGEEFGLNRPMK
jgi:hypothetical protein